MAKSPRGARSARAIRGWSSTASSRRPRAPCCARSASRMRTSPSRRSASPPPGPMSHPATCTSASWRARRRAGADAAGGKGVLFNTITVSDGISMGSPGMRYSLVSREVIADSIETVVGAEGFDGFVAIGGCDKNMPGCAMAMARLNRPAVFVYGGTIRPGVAAARHRLGVRGGRRARRRQDHRRAAAEVERTAIPGPGQLRRHVHRQHHGLGHRGARPVAARQLRPGGGERGQARRLPPGGRGRGARWSRQGIRPRDILTRKAFENAITVVHRPGRLDQCGAAPAGHRARGGREASPR